MKEQIKKQMKELEERNNELALSYEKAKEETRVVLEQMFGQYTNQEIKIDYYMGWDYTKITLRFVVEENEREQYIEMWCDEDKNGLTLNIQNFPRLEVKNQKNIELYETIIKIAKNISYLENMLKYVLKDIRKMVNERNQIFSKIESLKIELRNVEKNELEDNIKVGTKIIKKILKLLYKNDDDKYVIEEYEITKITPKYFYYNYKFVENGKEYSSTNKQKKDWFVNKIQEGTMEMVVE